MLTYCSVDILVDGMGSGSTYVERFCNNISIGIKLPEDVIHTGLGPSISALALAASAISLECGSIAGANEFVSINPLVPSHINQG